MKPTAAALLLIASATVVAGQGSHRDIWLDAVGAHEPGTWDAAAVAVSSWSNAELDALVRSLPLGRGRSADMTSTLIRGAMLHADVAMLAPPGHSRPLGPPGTTLPRRAVLAQDGQIAGVASEPPDWDVGRRLLDALDGGPATHPAARLWYRATLAVMARGEQLAAASSHFEHARKLFPDDPEVLATGGWLHEGFASPATQTLEESRGTTGLSVAVPGRTVSLARAHDFFTRALAVEPGFTEARIHRGRIAGLRGRLEESARDLERAVEEAREPLLVYLAALFLGGTREALDDLEGARVAYERAARLYPLAQSARIALSRLASRQGDRAGALRHAQQLLSIPADHPDRGDPLWVYQIGPGRHADARLAELHRAVREVRAP
jgi:hypothetical protein